MGLVPEDRKTQGLLMNLSVAENVDLASVSSSGPLKLITPQRERQVAREYVRTLNIRLHDVQQPVGDLSGGNQQKVVIAKWLDAAASILILDEPTRGVDVGSKREIYEIIRKLCDDDGATVILISSELPEILEMSDRILVMHQGEVATIMDRKDASEEAIMRYAVGGEETHLQYSEVTAGLVENVLGELKLEPSIYCGDKCKEALRLQADPESVEGSVALSWNGTTHPYGAATLEKGKQLQQKFFPKMKLQTLDGRDDATVQTSQVEDAIAGGIDVLIISPLTTDALVPVVNRAKGEGVKVITADRTVDTDVDLYIGANSVESGRIAGRYFVERLKDGGNVVEITGTLGASATIDRHKGFHEIIEEHPEIKVIADQTGNFVRGGGLQVMQDFLQRFPSGEIDAVYCHNDEMALGAYQAVKEAGREDEMFVTGFDGSDATFQSIKAGQMAATVVYPVMSTECLIGAAKMLAGEELPQEILLETPLVTKQNVNKYLGTNFG
jgi:ribose transport system substrate-binding protein